MAGVEAVACDMNSDYQEVFEDNVSDHVNQPKERSGKITKYCVHVF